MKPIHEKGRTFTDSDLRVQNDMTINMSFLSVAFAQHLFSGIACSHSLYYCKMITGMRLLASFLPLLLLCVSSISALQESSITYQLGGSIIASFDAILVPPPAPSQLFIVSFCYSRRSAALTIESDLGRNALRRHKQHCPLQRREHRLLPLTSSELTQAWF